MQDYENDKTCTYRRNRPAQTLFCTLFCYLGHYLAKVLACDCFSSFGFNHFVLLTTTYHK